jgi:SSS family solute:Na+ symporter
VSRNSFILAGIFSAVWFMAMISLGVVARNIIPSGTDEDHVLLNLVNSTMPVEGYAILLVVLMSVIMSSLNSLLNAGAIAFAEDVVKPYAKLTDRTALNVGRCATVAIAAVAAAGATTVPGIIKGLLICYTIWAPAILPAAIIGLWAKRPRPLAGILSMCVGTLVAVTFQFILPSAINVPAIIPALGSALLAYIVGHWLAGENGGASPTLRLNVECEGWK